MNPALSVFRHHARRALSTHLRARPRARQPHLPFPLGHHHHLLATANTPHIHPRRHCTAPPSPSPSPPPPPPASDYNVANALTVARLAAAPLAARFILSDEHSLALLTVAAAGTTDAVDGWLARRYSLQTTLGSYLDPAADKALVACAFGALVYTGALPAWIAAVVVGRDVVLVSAALVLQARGRAEGVGMLPPLAVQPSIVSKINTGLQIVLTVAGIAHGGGGYGLVTDGLIDALCVATAATTFASLSGYAYHVLPILFRRRKPKV